jgi:putative ABC transport system permease protein
LPPDQRGGWDTFQIEGQTWTQEAYPGVTHPQVTPQYFQTLGIPLLKGRFFTESDNLDAPRVCIISQTLAKRYFGHEDPIGRQLKEGGPSVNAISQYMQIVGVVADAKYTGLSEDPEPIYYMPMLQNYTDWRFYVAVKTALSAAALSPALQRASRIYDSALVVSKVRTMQEGIVVSVNEPRFRAVSMALFAGLALVLATIGIFGVIAYTVSQRTQEIGIRLALGAQRKDILAMVMKHGFKLTFLGMTIGLAGAFAISRLLASLLFRITATDAITFLAVVGLICGVALMACYVPARRAMRIDPLTALRYE